MTRDQNRYRAAYWIASFVIAGVLVSGYQKIIYPNEFAVAVYRFGLLPGFMVNLAAIYLPWLEMVCAFSLLLVPSLRKAAVLIVLVLLVLFTGAMGFNLWRGSAFGCGCFGRATMDHPLTWMNLFRNTGLMALAGLALLSKKRMEYDPTSPSDS